MAELFGENRSKALAENIRLATTTEERIKVGGTFLLEMLTNRTIIDGVVKRTIDIMLSTKGNTPINQILKGDPSKRRQLERKFAKQIGMSPKQLSKVISLQSALKMLINQQGGRFN